MELGQCRKSVFDNQFGPFVIYQHGATSGAGDRRVFAEWNYAGLSRQPSAMDHNVLATPRRRSHSSFLGLPWFLQLTLHNNAMCCSGFASGVFISFDNL